MRSSSCARYVFLLSEAQKSARSVCEPHASRAEKQEEEVANKEDKQKKQDEEEQQEQQE